MWCCSHRADNQTVKTGDTGWLACLITAAIVDVMMAALRFEIHAGTIAA